MSATDFKYVLLKAPSLQSRNPTPEELTHPKVTLSDDKFTADLRAKIVSAAGAAEGPRDMQALLRQLTCLEISTVLLPEKETGFLSVSIYSQSKTTSETAAKNTAATELVSRLLGGLQLEFYGDVYFSKIYDNETPGPDEGWRRIDFTLDDLQPSASWIEMAKTQIKRKGKVSSLAGLTNQVLKK